MIYELRNPAKAAPLFQKMNDTTITSCLQGIMGTVFSTSEEHPVSAMAYLGDFCFLAGEPDEELCLFHPGFTSRDFLIYVPENESWCRMIERCFGTQATPVTRYALKKEGDIFDREMLAERVQHLDPSYTLTMIDKKLFEKCKAIPWCRDWVGNYPDYALYEKYGLGYVILKDGEPVSGASSYSGYRDGIEIEIVTKEEYRRQGLAHICGAKLILECCKRGLYPSWDAQNKWSLMLSEKLGYHFDREYPAYEIRLQNQ